MGVVLFNDATRYASRGFDTEANAATVFDAVNSIYADGDLYDGDAFKCRVIPVLVGQVTWRGGPPEAMDYVSGAKCSRRCGADLCARTEVSSSCLLDSFSKYVHDHLAELEAIMGASIDAAHLLTGETLDSSTVGLAFLGGMCLATGRLAFLSSGVEQSSSGSVPGSTRSNPTGDGFEAPSLRALDSPGCTSEVPLMSWDRAIISRRSSSPKYL